MNAERSEQRSHPSNRQMLTGELLAAARTSYGWRRTRIAVGRSRASRVPPLLRGLRHGTTHFVLEGSDPRERILVGRFAGAECAWYAPVSELQLPSSGSGTIPWTGSLSGTLGRRDILLTDCTVTDGESELLDELSGWTRGRAGRIEISPASVADCWTVEIDGTASEWPLALDFQGNSIGLAPDGPGRTRIEVRSPIPTTSTEAIGVADELMWILRLVSPGGLDTVAAWSRDQTAGCVQFDRVSRSLKHELVRAEFTDLFLVSAAGAWSRASASDQEVCRLAIDMLLGACNSNLETSIVLSASALELIAEEWLPKAKGQYEVAPAARAAIKADLVAAAAQHAPGSEFARNAQEIAGWLFNHTAKERFRRLQSHFGMPRDETLVDMVNVRNKVVHGGYQALPLDRKIEAMFFGRWMLAECLLRWLNYSGPAQDWRRFYSP